MRIAPLVLWLALATGLVAAARSLTSQQGPAPAEPSAPLAPGLAVAFRSASGTDARVARVAALYVPSGRPPTPFLAPAPFQADFEGFLTLDLGTECTFSATGRGTLEVRVNGTLALEARGDDFSKTQGNPVFLKKGRNRLAVRYSSPAEGDAFFRLSWSSHDFPQEPVGPPAVFHDPSIPTLARPGLLRQGLEVLISRRCVNCHTAGEAAEKTPYMTRSSPAYIDYELQGPSLKDAGARLRPEWMARWIHDPRSFRADATMPRFADLDAQEAADLAAFLATLGAPPPEGPAPAPQAVAEGGRLFAQLRCAGCHTRPDRDPTPSRVPLSHVAAKWRPAALKEFLQAPARHYPWIGMPDFGLSDAEASALAAFLLARSRGEASPSPAGDARRGAERARARRCTACHEIPGVERAPAGPPALAKIPAEGWTRGCLAPRPAAPAPDFGLAEPERRAAAEFARTTDASALYREEYAPAEFAERQIRALRCTACHRRDGQAELWASLQGEVKDLLPPRKPADPDFEEAPAEELPVPSLTWIGEKLKPEWMGRFLKGEVPERPRPFLAPLRMPSFRGAEALARGLAATHGFPPSSAPEPAPDPELSAAGHRLAGPNGGFDCLACHGIGPRAATKVFEAPGPNLKLARDRLTKEYFVRWMRAPLRLEPGTKMPQFFPDGRSPLVEVLDGDAARQIEALWQYLLEGEKIRPPEE